MMTPTPSGLLGHRKGTKPSKLLDLSLLRSATDFGELPFQKGRPLDSSNKEGQTKPKTEDFAPKREVFMAHIAEIWHMDEEALEHVKLDDYYVDDDDDYISDTTIQIPR
jgi:hypothetical protein